MTKKEKLPADGAIRRTTTTEETILPPEPVLHEPPPVEAPLPMDPGLAGFELREQDPEEIQSLLSQLGDDDHKITVARWNNQEKLFARLDSYSHKEFDLDTLGDAYGGGKYKIMVFRPNGQIRFTKVVVIDSAKKPKIDPAQMVSTAQGAQVIMAPQQDNSKMFDLMVQQNNRSQEMFMVLVTKMAEAFASKAAPAAPAPSIVKDLSDVLAIQKMLEAKGDPAQNNMNTMLGVLKQGLELGQLASPNSGEGNSGGGVMDIVTGLLGKFVGNQPGFADKVVGALAPMARPNPPAPAPQRPMVQPTVQAQPQPQISQTPAPVPAPQVEEAVVETTPKEQTMDLGLRLVIAMYKGPVLDMAKQDFDAEKAADIIIMRIPESYYPLCLDFTAKPDRLAVVTQFIPELQQFSPWVDKVLTAGNQALTEYFKPEVESAEVAPQEVAEIVSPTPAKEE